VDNPFKNLIDGINQNFKDLESMFEENQKAMEKIKSNPLNKVEGAEKNSKLTDADFMRSLAEFCLGDLEVLAATLKNRTEKNDSGIMESAVFISVLKEEDKKKVLEKLDDKEKYMISKEVDEMPVYNKQTVETILFNIQADYFSRLDGEELDFNLFNDLFK